MKTFLALLTLALPPTLVANHVHLHVAWRANALVLEIFDFEAGAFPADAYPFVIGNAGVLLVPASAAFGFLGEPGVTFFALPQDENPNLPFLGVSMDNVPTGTFTGNQVNLRLAAITGPGHFALYQVNAFGQPTLRMNTRDGIAPAVDRLTLTPGGHEHQNWAFGAPGEYQLTFIADAVRQSDSQTISSVATVYRFRVLPPPKARLFLETGPKPDQPALRIQSRTGARLQLLETTSLGQWTTNTARLLAEPEWKLTPQPATTPHRFWRVQEVFE